MLSAQKATLNRFGLADVCSRVFAGRWTEPSEHTLLSGSPASEDSLTGVAGRSADGYEGDIGASQEAFLTRSGGPAPQRGEYVRLIGDRASFEQDRAGDPSELGDRHDSP